MKYGTWCPLSKYKLIQVLLTWKADLNSHIYIMNYARVWGSTLLPISWKRPPIGGKESKGLATTQPLGWKTGNSPIFYYFSKCCPLCTTTSSSHHHHLVPSRRHSSSTTYAHMHLQCHSQRSQFTMQGINSRSWSSIKGRLSNKPFYRLLLSNWTIDPLLSQYNHLKIKVMPLVTTEDHRVG